MQSINLGQNLNQLSYNQSLSHSNADNESLNTYDYYSINKEGAVNRKKMFSVQNKLHNDELPDDMNSANNSQVFLEKMQFNNTKDDSNKQQQPLQMKKSLISSRSSTLQQLQQQSLQSDLDKMRKEHGMQNLNISNNLDDIKEDDKGNLFTKSDELIPSPYKNHYSPEKNQQTFNQTNQMVDDITELRVEDNQQKKINIMKRFIKHIWMRILRQDFRMLKKFHLHAIGDKSCQFQQNLGDQRSQKSYPYRYINELDDIDRKMFMRNNQTIQQQLKSFVIHSLINLNKIYLQYIPSLSQLDNSILIKDVFLLIMFLFFFILLSLQISMINFLGQECSFILSLLNGLFFIIQFFDILIVLKTSIINSNQNLETSVCIAYNYYNNEFMIDVFSLTLLLIASQNSISQPYLLFIYNYFLCIKTQKRAEQNPRLMKLKAEYYYEFNILKIILTICIIIQFSVFGLSVISRISGEIFDYKNILYETSMTNQMSWINYYQKCFRLVFNSYFNNQLLESLNSLNSLELACVDAIQIIDLCILIYQGIQLSDTIHQIQKSKNQLQQSMKDSLTYLNSRGVSAETSSKSILYLFHNNRQNFNSQTRGTLELFLQYYCFEFKFQYIIGLKLIEKLPKQLQSTIQQEGYYNLLRGIEQLKYNFSKKFLKSLTYIVKERVIENDEIILQKNSILDKLYLFTDQNEIQYQLEFGNQDKQLKEVYQKERNEIHQDLKYFLTGHLCPFSIKSTCNKIIPYITIEEFQHVIKNYQKDYEKYCLIRDKIQHEIISLNRCNGCLQFNHDILQCPLVHYYPDRRLFYKFTDIQQRQFKERAKYAKIKSLKVRQCIRYDLILFRWHKVAEKNKLTNTRNIFNQFLTLSDNHFYKVVPKLKIFNRTSKEKHLKHQIICSNLENALEFNAQPIHDRKNDRPNSTFVQQLNSQLQQDRYIYLDESGKIENIMSSSNTINRRSIKKENFQPGKRNSFNNQNTQMGSTSQYRSSQMISQQQVPAPFVSNYHGIYSSISQSASENIGSQIKNDTNFQINSNNNQIKSQDEINYHSQLSAVQYPLYGSADDAVNNSKIQVSFNRIPQMNEYQQQQQQQQGNDSEKPSHLIIQFGNKDCNSGFSNLEIFEQQQLQQQQSQQQQQQQRGTTSFNQIENHPMENSRIVQKISRQKKPHQLSIVSPIKAPSQHKEFFMQQNSYSSMLFDNSKKKQLDSALYLEQEVYENYQFLKIFFSELNDKNKKDLKSQTSIMKDYRTLVQLDQIKPMKEIKIMLSQLKNDHDYSEHIFGPLEFNFDKLQQYLVYYPSFNYELVIQKFNQKITQSQKIKKQRLILRKQTPPSNII